MSVDLFEHIKIMSMNDDEKIELLDKGSEYLLLLINDPSMAVRIRAKMRISEGEIEKEKRIASDMAQLKIDATSTSFKVRIRAKAMLKNLQKLETA